MKAKFIALFTSALLGSSVMTAQSNSDCARTAALAYDDAKAKNYEAAYEPLMQVMEDCPKYSLATYQYGERALKHKIDNAEGDEKSEYIEKLTEVWEKRLELFPEKTSKGKVLADIAQLKFDNNIGDREEKYQAFDKAFEEDPESFTSPKGLYAYFSILVDMQDEGERSLEDVFEKYDDVIAKIEEEENDLAERLAPLVEKQEKGEELTAKEKRLVKNSEINLGAYNTVKNAINGKLGQRADCDNLIPLYSKDFEEKKGDIDWLRSANARLSAKDCTEDPLFMQVSEALHNLDPSAKSAFSLGQLAEADGDANKALEYYNQAAELEEDNTAKSRIYYRIASNYKSKNSYSQARNFYKKAVQAKPSLGNAYLQIATMYAKSANNCGETSFEKRAVYWLAADYARRAGRVDPSIAGNASQAAKSYMGLAPQKSDIFQSDVSAGDSMQIGCWIGESLSVPNL